MKKWLALALAVVLCFSLCACGGEKEAVEQDEAPAVTESVTPEPTPEPAVLIADVLDPASCEPERSVKAFQDIASFFGRRIDTWNETYRNVVLTEEERTAVLEYIDLLINEFNYEIVGGYHFDPSAADPFDGHFLSGTWEVCLGLATVDTGREQNGRETDVSCDIDLYCKKGELKMRFTDLFHTEDYGFRWSGSEGDRFNEVYGQRALDAYYLENGRYRNGSDGVLSVEAGTHGEAVILINGKEVLYSTDAGVHVEMYADYPRDDYEIEIYDFLDGATEECIEVAIHKSLTGGEVYTLSDALGWLCTSPIYVKDCCPGDKSGVSSLSRPTGRSAMNACTVRVLRWDETECVVYMAMDIVYELDPITIEVLAAMPPYGSLWGETFKETEAVNLKAGESLELEYDGPYVFMPNYETYEWKITSGQGASITGFGDKCTVTAVSPGQIIVKCVYSYGKDEPDVLTGIPRNENHTKSKLYYINIVP